MAILQGRCSGHVYLIDDKVRQIVSHFFTEIFQTRKEAPRAAARQFDVYRATPEVALVSIVFYGEVCEQEVEQGISMTAATYVPIVKYCFFSVHNN